MKIRHVNEGDEREGEGEFPSWVSINNIQFHHLPHVQGFSHHMIHAKWMIFQN